MHPLYAAEYGLGGSLAMDVRPLLDLIAARYDGCDECVQRHTEAIASDAALATHVVGNALRTLSDVSEVSAQLVVQHLDPAGAAIALTMRTQGLLAAVDVAAALSDEQRRAVVALAAGHLLQVSWCASSVGQHYERGGNAAPDDISLLNDLRSSGYLPQ